RHRGGRLAAQPQPEAHGASVAPCLSGRGGRVSPWAGAGPAARDPVGRLRGRRPALDLLQHRLEAELVGLAVDDLVADADHEDAVLARLELHALDALAEALEDGALHVHRARQVAAGDAVLDLDGGPVVRAGVAHAAITSTRPPQRQQVMDVAQTAERGPASA